MTVSEALTSTYVQSGFSFGAAHTHRLEGSESLRGPLKASEGIEESVIKVEMLSPEDAKKARKNARHKAYGVAYRAANKEKTAAKGAAYQAANKEKIAAYQKARREANPEKIAAYKAAYQAANKEKIATKREAARERQRSETEEQRLVSSPAVREFIAERVDAVEGGCWEWQKCIDAGGYGQTYWDAMKWATHRLSYNYLVARIPDGAAIHHKCASRACCNPDHLQATTQQDNTAEMMGRRFLEDEIGRLNLENDNLRQTIENLRKQVDYLASPEDL